MADILGSTATTSTIGVGGTVQGSLEVAGDHDWYRITLTAGQQITISLSGTATGGVPDPYVDIRNSTGAVLAWNDDSGSSLDSKLVFTATTSGTYYIDAGGYDSTSADWNPNAATPNNFGNYTLSVQPYTPPPVWSYDQIAGQLVSGYWASEGQGARHFAVSQGGSITVNYSTLTPAEQALAIAALGEWSDIIGVTFTPVTTGGQIRFSDAEDTTANGPVASTMDHTSGNLITYADVQISQSWVNSYGSTINSYGFQTYLHEIGHALGLGHAGDYNNTADYVQDALYANDAWSTTIMSYFDQRDNAYFANQGFTQEFVLTPMIADVVAMQQIYGASTTTRTGNTVYGFNSNLGNSVYNATYIQGITPSGTSFPGYTIVDSGGTDTLDYSGFNKTQLINLNPETFSDVGGEIGNVSIGRGTVIENAIGGSGADTIIGNSADNVITGGAGVDTLTGGAGNDTFRDTLAGLNGDTITDFSAGDKILITNATLSGFTFSVSGTTLTINGSTVVHLGTSPSGTVVASAASGGGVQLSIGATSTVAHHPVNDFNGDGRSDVLWRNDNGDVTNWLGQANGGFAGNTAFAYNNASTNWHIAGTGDFNGDGRADILWQSSTGEVTDWLGNANGGFVGTGDFNGDGRDDILWQDNNGTVTDWLGQANGSFVGNLANANNNVSASWHVVGTGDFNGDGQDDILWRNDNGDVTDWLGQANGGFIGNTAFAYNNASTSWHIVGTGDFNGDGRADILWQNNSGEVTDWLGNAAGGFNGNIANADNHIGANWQVVSVGDFNGDGRSDILWRDTVSGDVTDWLGQANGGFIGNLANADNNASTSWHVQPPEVIF